MKIKLLRDLPIDPKHGMTAGRVLEVTRAADQRQRGGVYYFVISDAGEEIGVLRREARLVVEEAVTSSRTHPDAGERSR